MGAQYPNLLNNGMPNLLNNGMPNLLNNGMPQPGFGSGFNNNNMIPMITPNAFMPQNNLPATNVPPMFNVSMPTSYPPMMPPQMPMPAISTVMQPYPLYRSRRARSIRLRRRHHRRRPVVRIIESSSCSTGSSFSTSASCSSYHRHSRSHSRHSKHRQQQPIILMPIQMPSQQCPTPSIQQIQPAIQQQQPLALVPSGGAHQQIVLPPIQIQGTTDQQGQPLVLPPFQLNSSMLNSGTSHSPIILNASTGGQLQQSLSMPQIPQVRIAPATQQGPFIQAASPIQYVTNPSVGGNIQPTRILVNNSIQPQNHPAVLSTSLRRPMSANEVQQTDLKFGRRPFDWYPRENTFVLNEDLQLGQRGATVVA
ncbi:unnamed protein product [Didymodactylos carnosus]|uniref:Uncharacterized protein n=1 Tax=Didymodactylos carnosus TaxID=1234261 RepID=A0A8S2J3B8_9BILA|nr:unnamed protein product [Didymodactylos carnosus]CAF3791733.1 unnamed protein product [Didymodactylos carnosus]